MQKEQMIQCPYCGCSIPGAQNLCPHCGAQNERAAEFLTQEEETAPIENQEPVHPAVEKFVRIFIIVVAVMVLIGILSTFLMSFGAMQWFCSF